MLTQAVTRGERHRRGHLNGAEAELLRPATAPPPARARAPIVEVESRSLRVYAEAAG